jgi:hypothetical protein
MKSVTLILVCFVLNTALCEEGQIMEVRGEWVPKIIWTLW